MTYKLRYLWHVAEQIFFLRRLLLLPFLLPDVTRASIERYSNSMPYIYVCAWILKWELQQHNWQRTESALRNARQVPVLGSTSGSSSAPFRHCCSCFHFHFHFCIRIRIRIQRSLAEMSSFDYLAVSLILSLWICQLSGYAVQLNGNFRRINWGFSSLQGIYLRSMNCDCDMFSLLYSASSFHFSTLEFIS